MKILHLLVSAVIVVSSAPEGAAAPAENPETAFRFARSLMVEGDYYRAITEFKRALFFAGPEQRDLRAEAIVGIAEALCAGQEYTRAAEWLHERFGDLKGTGFVQEGTRLMCRAYLTAPAGERLLGILDGAADLPRAEAEYYRPLALAATGDWAQARRLFLSLPAESPYRTLALEHAGIAAEAASARWKKPAVAAWLGIVPGAGYVYAGHRQTGVAALILNAVFWAATYEAFDSDQDVLGGFLAFVSVSWYASSIYGSVKAVHRYNRNLQHDYWSRMMD